MDSPPSFVPGQRWLSDSEPELGLGLVSASDARRVTLEFRQSGETRVYASANAPLSRVVFRAGDELRDRQGRSLTVLAVQERNGLARYRARGTEGEDLLLEERELADSVNLDQPLQRLLAGQVDHSPWFYLRERSLRVLHYIQSQPLLGLCSARTDLIPHQLYIASEVARRYAPRVLLADEVGLGKTIEAGLILQQQLFSGKAERVLILVPEALLHQWLVEMRRRFNLAFALFDEERSASLDAEGVNPFLAEQRVLCSNAFFLDHPERHGQALEAEWDLLIVDEAHHLKAPAPEEEAAAGEDAESLGYRQVQALAARVKGLILLTATPDQGGAESQFALLQLLDPVRFHDLERFRGEQARFSEVADLVEVLETLEAGQAQSGLTALAPALQALLRDEQIAALLEELQAAPAQRFAQVRQRLIEAILDRHGTGRVLYRNTRKTVSGFPKRVLHAQALPCPAVYEKHRALPQPESSLPPATWLEADPRVDFLLELLTRLGQDKLLLICARRQTAIALEEHLRLRKGLRSAVFHEEMSIVERDRAAAWFADPAGARVLICSEIGSEGRNFQFSHHLLLFDLPLNPDLLEQRIGRLDRIGQTEAVQIHVPWLQGSAQEVLYRWYHESLEAFTRTNPVAFRVFRALRAELEALFAVPEPAALEALLRCGAALNARHLEEHARGRDRLLELHSFSPREGERLLEAIAEVERAQTPEDYLLEIFASLGIEADEKGSQSYALQPGEHMLVEHFGGIPDDGTTVTFSRRTALHREDIQFITWQHPLLQESLDLILEGYHGKTALGLIKEPRLPAGSLLLDSLWRVQISAPRELELQRFLPCTTLRILLDSEGRELSAALSLEGLRSRLARVDKNQLVPLIAEQRARIQAMSDQAKALAEQRLPAIIKDSSTAMLTTLSDELKRLAALRKVNPNVRESEITFLKNQVRGLHAAMSQASLQLEGLLLVFVTQ